MNPWYVYLIMSECFFAQFHDEEPEEPNVDRERFEFSSDSDD